MTDISKVLNCNLKLVKRPEASIQYLVRTVNLEGNLNLNTYLEKFPLFSSKYLDFLCFSPSTPVSQESGPEGKVLKLSVVDPGREKIKIRNMEKILNSF